MAAEVAAQQAAPAAAALLGGRRVGGGLGGDVGRGRGQHPGVQDQAVVGLRRAAVALGTALREANKVCSGNSVAAVAKSSRRL